ncbi:MAG: hypothetical protein AABY07_08560 [Nanoarchaeota archaeon]
MQSLSNIIEVHKNKKYLALTLALAIFIILFMNILPNYSLLRGTLASGNISLFFNILINLVPGVFTNNNLVSLFTTFSTAILTGISISLLVFKFRSVKELKIKESGTITTGAIVGLLSSGCSACSVGLLASLGLVGGLATLPFKGYEVWSLGVILLGVSIYMTSKSISQNNSCKVNIYKKN